jgi:hypothetical protein
MPLTAFMQPTKVVKSIEDLSVIETLLASGADVFAQDAKGDTCLHNATAWGHLKAVRALIQAGADPLCSNYAGWAPENYSLTVQADVYYRNLVAEWQKQRSEDNVQQSERRGKGGGAVRLVSQDENDNEGLVLEESRSRSASTRSQPVSESETGLGISV